MNVLICVKDKKAREWQPPVVYPSIEAAKRDCHRAVMLGRDSTDGRKPLIAMYPEDFEIWHCGDFNSEDGNIASFLPIKICCVADLLDQIKE